MATDANLDILIRADASEVQSGMASAKEAILNANASIASAAQQVANATKAAGQQVQAAQASMVASTQGANAAVAAGLQEHANAMTASVSNMVTSMQGGIGGLSNVLAGVTSKFALLAAAVAGFGIFKDGIEETKKFTGEAVRLSRALGISATEASTLNVALGDIYSDAESFAGAAQMLSRQLRTNEDSLKKLGLVTRDANGEYRNLKELMFDSIGVIKGYKEGTDRALVAQNFFGRGAGDVHTILKLNNEVMAEAEAKQRALGLVVGVESVEATKRYKAAMNDVSDVMLGIKKAIGDAVMPIFSKLGEWFTSIGPAAVLVIKAAFVDLATVFWLIKNGVVVVWETINAMVVTLTEPLRAMTAGLAKAVQGDFAGAKAEMAGIGPAIEKSWSGAMKEMRKSSQETDKELRKLWGKPTAAPEPSKKGSSYENPKDKNEGQGAQFEAELAELRLKYQQEQQLSGQYKEFSKQQELDFWHSKLAIIDKGSKDELSIRKKIAEIGYELGKKDYENQLAIEKLKTEASTQRRLEAIDEEERDAQLQVSLNSLSKKELLALEVNFENRRNEIRRTALEERKSEAAKNKDLDPIAYEKALIQIEELEAAHGKKIAEIQRQTTLEAGGTWKQITDGISTDFANMFSSIAKGQQALATSLTNLAKSIASTFINATTQIMAKEAVHHVTSMAQTEKEKAADTVASTSMLKNVSKWLSAKLGAIFGVETADSAATISEVAEDSSTVASSLAASKAKVEGYVGEAGAAGVASFAAAPWPIDLGAPAFGAEMMASAQSLGSISGFEVGAWKIPEDGITKVHKGEAVLNATDAENFRNAQSGGNGSGGNRGSNVVNINATPMKGGFLMMHKDELAKAIKSLHRDNMIKFA